MAIEGFENRTPFAAEALLLLDERGATQLTLVVKATYAMGPAGPRRADEQLPLRLAPTYRGEPGASSLVYDSEVAFAKARADVVLLGHAQPERGRASEVEVSFRVGPIEKSARVFGDRTWKRNLGQPSISAPRPFEKVPLTLERAFGGQDAGGGLVDGRNPLGVGFLGAETAKEGYEGLPLPNVEDPRDLLEKPGDRPSPVAFGFVPPWFPARQRLAGTCDEAWRKERFPLLPLDFDRAHLNAAPANQQAPGLLLRGGERVEIVGASSRGPLRFSLPSLRLSAHARVAQEDLGAPLRLDTVIVDTDEHRVELVYRAGFPVHRRTRRISSARVELTGGAA